MGTSCTLELLAEKPERLREALAVANLVEPPARPRGVRERHGDRLPELEPGSDAVVQTGDPEDALRGQASNGDDQGRP
jgi:hypothetical protein